MRAALLCVLALSATGCRARREVKTDRLDGTYAVAGPAANEPVLRVSPASGGGFRFEERTTGEWKPDAQVPHVATEAEVASAVGTLPAGTYVFGLATDSVQILKLPSHWTGAGITSKSGFVLVSGGKVAAAQKIELGGR